MVTIDDFPMVTMYGSDFRKELVTMYQAITELNAWDKLSDDVILTKLGDMCPSHTGRTFNVAIIYMKHIHEKGLSWVKENNLEDFV